MNFRLISIGIALALLFGAMATTSATDDARVGATVVVETEGDDGDNTTAGNDTAGGDDPVDGNDTVDDDEDDDDATDDDTIGNHTDGDDDTTIGDDDDDTGNHTDGDDETTDGDDDTTGGDDDDDGDGHTDGDDDKDELEGEWEATDDDGDNWSFEFEDGKFTIDTPNGTYKGTYTVDETQDPPTIDLTVSEAPEGDEQYVGQVSKGIYEVEGGSLSLAWGEPGTDRVTSFDEEGALSLEATQVTPPEGGGDGDEDDDGDTPGFGATLLLGAMGFLAVAMLVMRRRRF